MSRHVTLHALIRILESGVIMPRGREWIAYWRVGVMA